MYGYIKKIYFKDIFKWHGINVNPEDKVNKLMIPINIYYDYVCQR